MKTTIHPFVLLGREPTVMEVEKIVGIVTLLSAHSVLDYSRFIHSQIVDLADFIILV